MTTQARERRSVQQNQQNPQNAAVVLVLIVGIVALLLLGAIWNTLFQHTYRPQPAPAAQVATTQWVANGQLADGLVLERYMLVGTTYHSGCAAMEIVITMFSAQELRCYPTLAIPPVSVVASTPLGLSAEQTSAILARQDRVLYMHSNADRLGADAAYFRDGSEVFLAVWVAGDCTPRIFNGRGGYWQMPLAPRFSSAENIPYGPGYLVQLPANWQMEWARDPAQTTAWRLCATQTFQQGGS